MKKKLIFLGTGGSVGVPRIGCTCPVCTSTDHHNQRLRPSVLLQLPQGQFLIDAGPDFRLQALRHKIVHLDGILLTHAHYDHTAGIDDLRPLYYQKKLPIPILLSESTAISLRERYRYLFHPGFDETFVPRFEFHILPMESGEISFTGINLHYCTYIQNGMPVNGYRIGDLAYLTDIRSYSTSIFDEMKGVRFLIISALRYTPSLLHFTIDEAIDFAKQLKVEKAWLTHLSHDLEYHQTSVYLPSNVFMAYDGLEIDFS